MKIIFLIHLEKTLGYSMERYTRFLSNGMTSRGHEVDIWGPKLYLSKYNIPNWINKWLRYLDQYVLFPISFKRKSKDLPKETLFVLIDQALGIWMPLLQHKKHVVHCHDFIALKSALGTIKENATSWSGKIYQRLILKGFSKAHNFISVSKNTKAELIQFLEKKPSLNEQVYNALDPIFVPGSEPEARRILGNHLNVDLEQGYILHVGGNTFYKNRVGVIEVYNAWRKKSNKNLSLLLVGGSQQPTGKVLAHYERSPYKQDIYFLPRVDDQLLLNAYQGATVFVFPSLLEGFGFPIAEAMASGCPVITTNEAPMNEVGGSAALYIERCPNDDAMQSWAIESAKVLEKIVQLNSEERAQLIRKGLINAERFKGDTILDSIEHIYKEIVYEETLITSFYE
ncbi:MAG: glycosyltransferase family 4 protein [Flavobacteriales bacterium]